MRSGTLSSLAVMLFLVTACNPFAREEEFDLEKSASMINQKCPQMIDSETRIDAVEVKEHTTLVYRYTLVNLSVANVDTHNFYLAMWPGLLSTVKVSREMEK